MNTPAGGVVGLDSYRRTADLRQAEYYRQLLEDQRAQIAHELAGHTATLAGYRHDGDLLGVRQMRRLVRAKETELKTIAHLLQGLALRFGPRGIAPSR